MVMSIFDNIKAEITKAEAGFAKDEQWVISEITKGWQLLQNVGHTAEVDIENIFTWVQTHQSSIIAILQKALSAAGMIGLAIPQAAPAVAAATVAIDAATVAVDTLSKAVVAGSTPLSTAVNAYHAVKAAQSAVNTVITQATAKPPAVAAAKK